MLFMLSPGIGTTTKTIFTTYGYEAFDLDLASYWKRDLNAFHCLGTISSSVVGARETLNQALSRRMPATPSGSTRKAFWLLLRLTVFPDRHGEGWDSADLLSKPLAARSPT